ncbi:MAG: LPS assembly protein LptD [Alphaproteobacteria bacterium]
MRRCLAHLLALALFVAQARAQVPEPTHLPVVLTADEVTYNEDLGTVIAKGNVEIAQGERVLLADSVTYNQRTNIVIATGNVSLLEPKGDVIFADYVELTDDMKDGIIQNLGMLLSDRSRFAATGGRLQGGTKRELRKAVYSACELCQSDPMRAPLWQVKAVNVVHDTETHDVTYHDAWLEMFGIPVAYTPYLSHPDPTVERRTGLLAPTFGNDSQLGKLIRIPYFFDLGPDKDFTFEPIVTTKERAVLGGEYRQRFAKGFFETSGSITRVPDRDPTGQQLDRDINRGHIFGKLRYDMNETWRSGFDGGYTSDDTYLRRYKYSSQNVIINRPFVEGFRGNNYALLQGYYFRGLRAQDNERTSPLILPMADYNYVGQSDSLGGRWYADAGTMVLSRFSGANSRRASLRTGWERPYTTTRGDVWTTTLNWDNDLYWVDSVPNESQPGAEKLRGVTGRSLPQGRLDWRYPFVRERGGFRQIIEPVAGVILAPVGNNPQRIPNEDSQDFELDDTNLSSLNVFPGIDRIQSGSRAIYGLHGTAYGNGLGVSEAFFGQIYQFQTQPNLFQNGSGLNDKLSDYVGRLRISPSTYFDLLYRFRLEHQDLKPARTELNATGGVKEFRLGARYLNFEQNADVTNAGVSEQLYLSVTSQFTKNWSTRAAHIRNLGAGGGPLAHALGLTYEDECFLFDIAYTRTFTQDRDLRPSSSVLFRAIFKTLGEVRSSAR